MIMLFVPPNFSQILNKIAVFKKEIRFGKISRKFEKTDKIENFVLFYNTKFLLP